MPKLPIKIATAKKAVSREEYEAAKSGLPVPVAEPALPATIKRRGKLPVAVSEQQIARVISDFQSDTQEIVDRPDPLLARLTLFVLAALVVAGLTWASLANIDRIVTARGKIIATVPSLVVQPLDTAIIKTIDVKVGDVVSAGATLATLDPTFNEADVAQLQARLDSLDAQVARLEAEYDNRTFAIPVSEERQQFLLQQRIWAERQSQYQAQMRSYEQKMASIQADLDSKKQTMAQLQSRDKIAGDLLNMRRALEETQAGSKERTLRALQESLEARREVTTVASTIQQHQHELESLAAEREVFIKQWQARLSEELVARRDERSGIIEQYSKAKRRLALVRLETPVDAVVLEIAPRSVGSVISSAEPLVKLVPLNAPLEVEANISAQDFGHVRIGDPVELKLDAYSFMEYGVLRGEVMIISEDAFQDRQGMDSVTVYKARIRLVTTTLDTNNQPDSFRLVPGMPLSAEIKVGERSVIKYFLRPVLRGLKEGLREP